MQRQHSSLELLGGHAVILDDHAHVAAGVQGIVLVGDAVLLDDLVALFVQGDAHVGRLAEADHVPIDAVGEAVREPVDLLLPIGLCLGLLVRGGLRGLRKGGPVFFDQGGEGGGVPLVEPGDDAQVPDLLVAELARR